MNFDLDEGQLLARESIGRFLGPVDVAARHALRKLPGRYSRVRWNELAELGLLALATPEALDGMGGSMIDLVLVAETLGAGLAIDPWLENGILPLRLAAAAGDASLVGMLLSGSCYAAVGFAEPGRGYEFDPVSTQIDRSGRVVGSKIFVLGAALADTLLITAVDGEQLRLAVVAPTAADCVLRDYPVIDGSLAATVDLHQVEAAVIDLPRAAFHRAIGDVRLLAAAEMLGLAQRMFDDTLTYMRQREQFGVAIGTFQALQHRLVECYAALEQARSMVLRTAMRDPATDDAVWPRLTAGAKAYVGEAAMGIGLEAVQIHGGMGQTNDLAIGHALKRVMLLDKYFGDQAHGLHNYARAP